MDSGSVNGNTGEHVLNDNKGATSGSNVTTADTEDVVLTQPVTSIDNGTAVTEPSAPEYTPDDSMKHVDYSSGEPYGGGVVFTQPQSTGNNGNYIDGQPAYMVDKSEPNPGYVRTQQPLGQQNNKTNTDGYTPSSTYVNTVGGSNDDICCYAMLLSCHNCCHDIGNSCRCRRCCNCDSSCDDCCNCDCDVCDCSICDCLCGSDICECCSGVGECLGECLGGFCGGMGECLCGCLGGCLS